MTSERLLVKQAWQVGGSQLPSHPERQPPIALCVPVRNERRRLPALLDGLAAQTGCDLPGLTVCFLFDACGDGSEPLVRARAASLPFRIVSDRAPGDCEPNAGLARRRAVALGLVELGEAPGAVLLTTDADSVPAETWIAANLRGLRHADLVTGRVERVGADPGDRLGRLETYLDRLYALRRAIDPVPWEDRPTHHFTSGASLAFRAAGYRAIGGFEPKASGEDGAIVDAAQRIGLRVRRDREVRVVTSSRRAGRAPDGLAATLRRLNRSRCGTARVSDPAAMVWQYEGHALARRLFGALPASHAVELLRQQIGLSAREILEVADECVNAEAFATRIVPPGPAAGRSLMLDEAEQALSELERRGLDDAA